MARIETLKFEIRGKEYVSHVNVGKDGLFKLRLHWEVAQAIGLDSGEHVSETLKNLTDDIIIKYQAYLQTQREFTLWIAIQYKSSGAFIWDSDGKALFEWRSEFDAKNGSYLEVKNQLHFDYNIYAKELTTNGTELWYDVSVTDESDTTYPWTQYIGDFTIGHAKHSKPDGRMIPHSEEAIATLSKAKEGIRSISEILAKFLSQDEKVIESSLRGGNLLENKSEIDTK